MHLENSKPRKNQIAAAILSGLTIYTVLVLASIFAAAGHIRTMPPGSSTETALGPLSLLHVQKTALAGGSFSLDFKAASGLIVLFIACSFFAAALWAIYKFKKRA